MLDACVLYPAPLRDLLISLAADGLYGARWTADMQDEWIRNLQAKRPDLDPRKLRHTASLMTLAIDDALIQNYHFLIPRLELPDPDDRHVLAAAIVGHADAIVTFNLRDFPEAKVAEHEIEILHPDDFLIAQYDLDPIFVLKIIKASRTKLKKPPKSAEESLATLEQQGLPQTCQIPRNAIDLI